MKTLNERKLRQLVVEQLQVLLNENENNSYSYVSVHFPEVQELDRKEAARQIWEFFNGFIDSGLLTPNQEPEDTIYEVSLLLRDMDRDTDGDIMLELYGVEDQGYGDI